MITKETIDKAFVESFNIGASTNEPTIRQIIYRYYRYTGVGMHPIAASNCTSQLIDAFLNKCMEINDL